MMAPEAVEARMARAKEIVSHPEGIEKIGPDEWSVPSQTGFGRYRVWFVLGQARCTCPDFKGRATQDEGEPCKHAFAVLDLRLREVGKSLAVPSPKPRKQYRQHPAYT